MTPDVSVYSPVLPSDTVLESIVSVEVNGIQATTVVGHYMPGLLALDRSGVPTAVSIAADTALQFYPIPDDAHTFRGIVSVKPSLTASGVEEFIYTTHSAGIVAGAQAELLNIPNKAWTNALKALEASVQFSKHVTACKWREFRNANLRVAPRPFA